MQHSVKKKILNFSVFNFRWCRRIQRKTCPLKSSGSRSVWIPVFIFVCECALRRATSVTETIKASISIISIHLSMSVSDDIKYSLWNLKYLLVFFKREIERYRERQSHGDKETERDVLFFVSNVQDSYSKNQILTWAPPPPKKTQKIKMKFISTKVEKLNSPLTPSRSSTFSNILHVMMQETTVKFISLTICHCCHFVKINFHTLYI